MAKKLWEPAESFIQHSNLTKYIKWLRETRGRSFKDYQDLWEGSVASPADFWESLWHYFKIISHAPYTRVKSEDPMPFTRWFEGSTLNYAEHVFRMKTAQHPALLFASERHPLKEISWQQLEDRTAALQSFLRKAGVGPGDRVAAYLPNIPEATVSLLATLSLGAVWSSCSPDFGAGSVLERFQQIAPRVLIAADGYTYQEKSHDRTKELQEICRLLPSVEQLILVPYLKEEVTFRLPGMTVWDEVMQTPGEGLYFEPVPFSHPIWILYSSGTTGIPKSITHGHGGMLLEHLKYLSFHNDVHPGENFFWYSTTGWMMWNFVQASLLVGATAVLYDGSPVYPGPDALWRLAEEAPIHHFGTSAPFITACMKAGLKPGAAMDLSALRSIGSTGSPLPPMAFDYVYESIKEDAWLCSMSGGTDVCTAWVGGCPWRPVYEGEIQCRCLGAALYAYDEEGHSITDEVGEMVIVAPMPCMPVYFWNDPDNERYLAGYFEQYPGVWRHGDWVKITRDDGVVILGRSDATLNRQGVRIGTAEIYRAVDKIPEIKDSLIVNLEKPEGGDYMPLFVIMQEGCLLTDEIKNRVKNQLRHEYSPRHVPDDMIPVPDIPYTISGKKMETPVKKILLGKPLGKSVNKGAIRNPGSLDFFIGFSHKWKDVK